MATNKDKVIGTVTETLAGSRYRVVLKDDGREVMAYLAGKMKLNRVSIYVGDKVEIVLDPAGGKATNRIVWRL